MGAFQSTPRTAPASTLSEKAVIIQDRAPVPTADELAESLSVSLDLAIPSGSVSLPSIGEWQSSLEADHKLSLSRTILSKSDPSTTLLKPAAKVTDAHVYNTQLDFKAGPITSQNASGRCWMFATTNVLRYAIMKKLNLEDFQLSQSYFFFYDKLEKSNYYLENMLELVDEPLDSRLISFLNTSPIGDGGQWDMAVNILEKYGVVPQAVFPESYSSSNSRAMDTLLTTKLREYGLSLRRQSAQLLAALTSRGVPFEAAKAATHRALEKTKGEYMKEVYTILSVTLGIPPQRDESFKWDYYDKPGNARVFTGTPIQFFKTFATTPYDPLTAFSIVNDPRNSYNALYSVERLGNVWGARPVLYVNTEIDRLKGAIVRSIKANQPVFFGCDVSKSSDRDLGIMDCGIHDYENAFNITLGLKKAERMQLGESAMTHAMVITAVHLDEAGKPVRYKVENSWGPAVGDKGFFVMTDAWFDEYVYQVVVPKALADLDLVKIFEKGEKHMYPAWDPMGALA
ncbi:peptidase C1B bleomycin hydrolase [Dacryopinax primogenitus]|uniref:Cysteine proteinase 1, mitochondrial n=1 Tax=Dacryopinax primogenitus (strain DJM 731) TaxID=1858805 RepID=M5G6G0_DACPD|nr:peptidase C1B bleomycin hydrolase [Dacryopinax primogenitus]EJU04279.1 peptidase C1B bleomycin hydrolase [Dacryopinax primogenitus]